MLQCEFGSERMRSAITLRIEDALPRYRPFECNNEQGGKFGGAVGVLPPESKKPNRRVLQAQLRFYLIRTDASKPGLTVRCRSLISHALRITRPCQPDLLTGRRERFGPTLCVR